MKKEDLTRARRQQKQNEGNAGPNDSNGPSVYKKKDLKINKKKKGGEKKMFKRGGRVIHGKG